MKRLDQMTMREYIDLRCGEYPEGVTSDDVARLVTEYQSICDPAGVKSRVHKVSGGVKDEMRLKVLRIVQLLLKMGYADDATSVYEEFAGTRFNGTHEALSTVVDNKIKNIEFSIKRSADVSEKDDTEHVVLTPDMIRRKYDQEVAGLMAYHKMPISIDAITASVYAHLVCNTQREIKAKLASTRRR